MARRDEGPGQSDPKLNSVSHPSRAAFDRLTRRRMDCFLPGRFIVIISLKIPPPTLSVFRSPLQIQWE